MPPASAPSTAAPAVIAPSRADRPSGRALLSLALATTATATLAAGCQDALEPPAGTPRIWHLALPGDGDAPPDPEPPAQPSSASADLASIATETSVYEEPRWGSRRLGYLRAGAVVARGSEPVAAGPRCPAGWYRVEPRGFVCVGPLATLDVHHPVVVAASHPPRRDGLPWLYALSRSPPPPLYARLPSAADQLRFEPDLRDHLARVGAPRGLPPPDDLPAWLAPGHPSLSLGNEWHGPDRIVLGQARPRSGFAVLTTVEHDGRRFGVTAGLEVIPLDRTHVVEPSRFAGVALGEGWPLPIAFVRRPGAFRVTDGPRGLAPGAALELREAVAVTDEVRPVDGTAYVVARDGSLLRRDQVVVVKPPRRPPAWAAVGVKWIDVSITRQTLVAYEGTRAVYATLVSTGVGGTGDPEETHATIQGAFKIYEKHVSVTMDGHEASDAFDLRDVPFVQYFHKGFALHAAYWHDDFGHPHSHGCVNLAPADAAWLFQWTDPHLPPGWHGTLATTPREGDHRLRSRLKAGPRGAGRSRTPLALPVSWAVPPARRTC